MRLLVVEDEDAIAVPLADGLRREGFAVQRVATGADALAAPEPDLVLLDLRLPDMDGYEVARQLRARSRVPIIMVTARGEEVDRVVGLELGADDYVVKPFGLRELIARINAVMRRVDPTEPGDADDERVAGPLRLSARQRRVWCEARELQLTPREFDILALLLADPGAVVSRDALMRRLWGTTWAVQTKAIDVHISALRRKLDHPEWIETVRGVGFRLAVPPR
ncbi:MAG TPA: response regulator transcription factor [Miltoncostaeaceae bacterium]|nr:response regulator transcription factor [Miltoncostaeaceae bacterium]